jgi:hypothetical protein
MNSRLKRQSSNNRNRLVTDCDADVYLYIDGDDGDTTEAEFLRLRCITYVLAVQSEQMQLRQGCTQSIMGFLIRSRALISHRLFGFVL